MIKAGIIGATGYTGNELVRILMQHPEVALHTLTSQSYIGQHFDDIYQNFQGLNSMICEEEDLSKMAEECDVVFLALPHGMAAKKVTEAVLKQTKIIDLGADFRLQNADIYEKWYEIPHGGRGLLPKAVYGLCELNRDTIKDAKLIANPGCYTTCSILSLAPLVAHGLIEPDSIVIDAKSGVSGAGRSLTLGSMYCERNENLRAYKVASHRHTPEIEEQLSYQAQAGEITLTFTPHLIPMNRGILATCYAKLTPGATEEKVRDAYMAFYEKEYFVRVTKAGVFPETRWVKGSNFADIGFQVDERTGRIVVIGAIDNLVKGAAGQAVQNMNLLFGLDETTGLTQIPAFPG